MNFLNAFFENKINRVQIYDILKYLKKKKVCEMFFKLFLN